MIRTKSLDTIFNPEAIVPPRPTISNLQWISGTQHVTSNDLDLLSKTFPLRWISLKLTVYSRWSRPTSFETDD